MWFGVAVIGFIGVTVLALVVATFKMARRRQWAMAAALGVPTAGFAYLYLTLAGPPLWITVFGDPNLDGLPETAAMVTAEELETLFSNQTHDGKYYDDRKWFVYRESHSPEGQIKGSGGPPDNPTLWNWTGSWKLEGENICRKYDEGYSCGPVYRVGAVYQQTDEHDKVSSEFTIDLDGP